MGQAGQAPQAHGDITAIIRGFARFVEREVPGTRVECDATLPTCGGAQVTVACLVEFKLPLASVKVAFVPVASGTDAVRAVSLRAAGSVDKVVAVVPESVDKSIVEELRKGGVEVVGVDEVVGVIGPLDFRRVTVKTLHAPPKLQDTQVRAIAGKYKGWLFRRGDYVGHRLFYLPVYVFKTVLHRIDYADELLEATEAYLAFEAVTGTMVSADRKGTLVVRDAWSRLGDLSYYEVKILELIAREGAASLSVIKAHLEMEEVQDKINVLLERGLIDEIEEGVYTIKVPRLNGYLSPLRALEGVVKEGKPTDGVLFDAEAPFSVIRRVVSVFGEIAEAYLLYYPIYIIAYSRRRDGRKLYSYIAISGVSGERMSDVEEILTSSGKAMAKINEAFESSAKRS